MRHLFTLVCLGMFLALLGSCAKTESIVDEDNLLIGTWEAVRAVEREYVGDELVSEMDTANPDDHFSFDLTFQFVDHRRVRITGEDIEGKLETTYSLSSDGKSLSIKGADESVENIQLKNLTFKDMEWLMRGEGYIDGDEVDPQIVQYEREVYLKRMN